MTPREHKKHLLKSQEEAQEQAEAWHVPLFSNGKKLKTALKEMDDWRLESKDIPWIIKAIENPKSLLCEFGIFPGCVNLFSHDCIHIILGRGILPKDEAFVIGFTMGTTRRVTSIQKSIFKFVTRFLYPEGYTFGPDEHKIFEIGLRSAGSMPCPDFSKLDLTTFTRYTIKEARKRLGIDVPRLIADYTVERSRYASSESQRLL